MVQKYVRDDVYCGLKSCKCHVGPNETHRLVPDSKRTAPNRVMKLPHVLIVDSKVLIKYFDLFQENHFEWVDFLHFKIKLWILGMFWSRCRRGRLWNAQNESCSQSCENSTKTIQRVILYLEMIHLIRQLLAFLCLVWMGVFLYLLIFVLII